MKLECRGRAEEKESQEWYQGDLDDSSGGVCELRFSHGPRIRQDEPGAERSHKPSAWKSARSRTRVGLPSFHRSRSWVIISKPFTEVLGRSRDLRDRRRLPDRFAGCLAIMAWLDDLARHSRSDDDGHAPESRNGGIRVPGQPAHLGAGPSDRAFHALGQGLVRSRIRRRERSASGTRTTTWWPGSAGPSTSWRTTCPRTRCPTSSARMPTPWSWPTAWGG